MKLLLFIVFSVVFVSYVHGFGRMNFVQYEEFRNVKLLGEQIRHKAMIYEHPTDVSIYYSVIDNHTLDDMMPRPWRRPGQSLRLPFIGEPCACSGRQCGCCAGIKIPQLNFDNKACANVSYDPSLFGLVLDVAVNDNVLIHNVYSAKNPPPFCIPVIISGVPTGVDLCIKLYDIYISGLNLHVCVDFETRIVSAPVLVLHFDCVWLGVDGIAFVKPDDAVGVIAADDNTTPAAAIYDAVTEIKDMNNDIEMATESQMLELTTMVDMLDETTVDSKRIVSAVEDSTLVTINDLSAMSSMVDDDEDVDEDEDEDEDKESITDYTPNAITLNTFSEASTMENVSENTTSTMTILLEASTTEKMNNVSTLIIPIYDTIVSSAIAEESTIENEIVEESTKENEKVEESTKENEISEDYIEEMNVFESKKLLNYRKRYL